MKYQKIKLIFHDEAAIKLLKEWFFCGFYRCVTSGEPLTHWVKLEKIYVKFVSDSPEFYIDKIYKNNI